MVSRSGVYKLADSTPFAPQSRTTMPTLRVLSFILASVLALAAANPLECKSDKCLCTSPTGCPGRCEGNSLCVGYCGTNTTVVCGACGDTSLACILDDDGTCFTVNE
ncbi:hypothetical protein B0H15DRAFT_833787 [Mycena belliarum]|uniref:Uncharacterized protein n=1 Tax=Mycena belliarum TaxID=1033014 RepID=A0AAD6UBY5_9AGAR|nr:hypothetical protein B0H15DRAFT_833787 [Mycena belliae]